MVYFLVSLGGNIWRRCWAQERLLMRGLRPQHVVYTSLVCCPASGFLWDDYIKINSIYSMFNDWNNFHSVESLLLGWTFQYKVGCVVCIQRSLVKSMALSYFIRNQSGVLTAWWFPWRLNGRTSRRGAAASSAFRQLTICITVTTRLHTAL